MCVSNLGLKNLSHYLQVLGQGVVLERLKEAICEEIILDRKGEAINRACILSLGSVLKKLGTEDGCTFYEDIFEKPILSQSLAYYQVCNPLLIKSFC
jgi:hypothetical protein